MIQAFVRTTGCLSVAVAIWTAGASSAHAAGEITGHLRTQEIALSKGWNAVFLEVAPLDASPSKVFEALPVDKVATLFESPTSNQFVTDPGVDLFKGQGWGVWYAPGLPEAFLKSLDAIQGNRAYLIHATRDCQWRASGTVKFAPPQWVPDAFNLVGFSVRSPGGPTFGQFFAGSKAHQGQLIYRLVSGRWKKVLQPGSEAMRSGEAFWIFCKGASSYQGPLTVEPATSRGLVVGRGESRVILRNACAHPVAPTLEHVAGGGPAVPLSILVKSFGDPAAPIRSVPAEMPAGPWVQPVPALEAGASVAVPFESRGGQMSQPRQGSLLKITTDMGTVSWIPVTAFRDDLSE